MIDSLNFRPGGARLSAAGFFCVEDDYFDVVSCCAMELLVGKTCWCWSAWPPMLKVVFVVIGRGLGANKKNDGPIEVGLQELARMISPIADGNDAPPILTRRGATSAPLVPENRQRAAPRTRKVVNNLSVGS